MGVVPAVLILSTIIGGVSVVIVGYGGFVRRGDLIVAYVVDCSVGLYV